MTDESRAPDGSSAPDDHQRWEWEPEPPEPPSPRRERVRNWTQAVVCLGLLAVAFISTVGTGHTDSAMVFVGLPTLLSIAIVLSPRAGSVHGIVFKCITVGLLVAAVLVREGVVCLIFAAPLVYAIGHGVVGLLELGKRRAYAVLPIALLLGLEGLVPGVRVAPDQTVTVAHQVALPPSAVVERIAAGPDFGRVRKPVLLAMIPLPGHVSGAGLEVGDGWLFGFHGDTHGPGGDLVCRIDERTLTATGGRLRFTVVGDTSVVKRWLHWTGAELSWSGQGSLTQVSLTMHFIRGLDPSWYFGPLEQVMVSAGADLILDALDLPVAA